MSDKVDSSIIEELVGAERHFTKHIGKASTRHEKFYIMHSKECVDEYVDLTQCDYSLALDRGTDYWPRDVVDRPVVLAIGTDGHLYPAKDEQNG